jgi:hypothetical protein
MKVHRVMSCVSVVSTLLWGPAALTFAQGVGGGGPGLTVNPGGMRGPVKIQGRVVCTGCTLDAMREQRPELKNLYEFRHDQGNLVLQIDSLNDSAERGGQDDPDTIGRWAKIMEPPLVAVRSEDKMYQKLLRPENREKIVEIAGMVRPSRTLDITDVTIAGEQLKDRAE